MPLQTLKFVASLSVCPSDIRKIRTRLAESGSSVDPLENVLTTPLFVNGDSLNKVHEMADEGKRIYFDSGGYNVQTGKIAYNDLYMPLLKKYRENRWASLYILPDHVPKTQDSPEVVAGKVNDTITFSSLFFHEMPDELKARAMPVVQGHTLAQIEKCLVAYLSLGVRHVGFGSFGTVGSSSEVNIATNGAVELARYVAKVAHANGVQVHAFGLGVPALAAMLKGIEADSFDSASWLKSAGFGQVFLPFMRSYNISYRSTKSEIQRGITFEQFRAWKQLTGHQCAFCASLEELQRHKMHRAVHNVIVMKETVDMVNRPENEQIQRVYAQGSLRYREEYNRWLKAS